MPVQYPLIVSTLCQRLSLGVYSVSLLAAYLWGMKLNLPDIAAVALIIFSTGLLASLVHLGRPQRMMNSFSNPKSRLTQEGLVAPIVALLLFLQAIDGRFVQFSPSILSMIQLLAVVASIAFILATGLVYQLFARPAWKTKLVSINFFLSYLTLGTVGTYAIAVFENLKDANLLLYLVGVSTSLTLLGQIYYLIYVGKLKYGVAIEILNQDYMTSFIGWLITGVIGPIGLLTYLLYSGPSTITAIALLVSSVLGLVFWRMFFFLAAKEIKFFPQYSADMTTDF